MNQVSWPIHLLAATFSSSGLVEEALDVSLGQGIRCTAAGVRVLNMMWDCRGDMLGLVG